MRKELLVTVSALSLLASTSIGMAQEKGGMGGAGQMPGGAQQAPSAHPDGAAGRGDRMQPSQSQQPRAEDSRDNRAQGNQPGAEPGHPGAQPRRNQAQEHQRNQPAKNQAQEQHNRPGTNQAQERQQHEQRNNRQQSEDRTHPQRKDQTTGQGAAGSSGASLTTEQRTKISTTIRQSHVRPVNRVNFNISVGTVVPRNVTLHALPAAVVEVYPDWRPYRFVLVGDEIVIIDPATHRIIAVLEA